MNDEIANARAAYLAKIDAEHAELRVAWDKDEAYRAEFDAAWANGGAADFQARINEVLAKHQAEHEAYMAARKAEADAEEAARADRAKANEAERAAREEALRLSTIKHTELMAWLEGLDKNHTPGATYCMGRR